MAPDSPEERARQLAEIERRFETSAIAAERERERNAGHVAEQERERARLEVEIATLARPAADRVWRFVEEVHADGTISRVRNVAHALGLRSWTSVRILGPVGDDGRDTTGGGSYSVGIRLDEKTVTLASRTGTWGHSTEIKNADELLEKMPVGVLGRLDQAVGSNGAWKAIVDELRKALHERRRDMWLDAAVDVVGVGIEVKQLRDGLRALERKKSG